LELPVSSDVRGRLTALEGEGDIPFPIARVYYLYDVPSGESRAGHAHWNLEQVLIAVSGSFAVTVDDGMQREQFIMNRPFVGLHISRLVWREIDNFSSGAVCLVIASEHFNEADYIRDYESFIEAARS
jgi:hypothetical protein